MQKVICFGEVLWDCFPNEKQIGGAPLNVALHLKKQGFESKLISAVGGDEDGKDILEFIRNQHSDTSLLQTHGSLPTGTVQVHLDAANQATYTIVAPVAWDEIQLEERAIAEVKQAEAFVFGSLACRSETSRKTLLRLIDEAKFRVFDMNLRPPHFTSEILEQLIAKTDFLKLNEHELEYLCKQYALAGKTEDEQIIAVAKKFKMNTVCVTLGERGALVFSNNKLYKHFGYEVEVADTVGAGDAFLATFIKGLLDKEPVEKTIKLACAAGALVASKAGANPDYTIKNVNDLILR